MRVLALAIPDILLIEPTAYPDSRGMFWEFHRHFMESFVQDNVSISKRGVVRGLHFQHPHGQTKLVGVMHGEIFDVAVDVRVGSPTFGQSVHTVLSATNRRQMYIPAGFAHGFFALTETATVLYKCSTYYAPEHEGGILWNDPKLAIPWPSDHAILSPKDAAHPVLTQISPDRLPHFEASSTTESSPTVKDKAE